MPRSLPLASLRVTDQFWSDWQNKLVAVTLPQQWEQLESTKRLENFRRSAKGEKGGFEGYRFNDSDVYKWLEAACWALVHFKDAGLRKQVDECVALIKNAQMEDGYLNTYFQLGVIENRWRNLNAMHEGYCGGHMIEAAVAHFEATGNRDMVDVALKWVNHVRSTFGPEGRRGTCGHPELELALLKFSHLIARLGDREESERLHQDALWHLAQRGSRPSVYEAELNDPEVYAMSPAAGDLLKEKGSYSGEYAQDHVPIHEQRQVVGHAVRAMYLYTAAIEVADEMPAGTAEAIQIMWENLVNRRMYITGGVGPAGRNEGFTTDYDLPNLEAYAETCASIGLVRWAQKMFERTPDSSYIDVLEKALYNGSLSGISLSGDLYGYTNPLENRGGHNRVPWYGCACCPPNIARTIAEVARFAIAEDETGIWINLPISLEAETRFGKISLEGRYPEQETFSVTVGKAGKFALRVRIPDWCDEAGVEVDGDDEPADFEAGYAVLDREWKAGDKVLVTLEMPTKWMEADPNVLDNLGRVALQRGPIVYCLEDDTPLPQQIRVDLEEEPTAEFQIGGWRLGGVDEGLYVEVGTHDETPVKAKMIPFAHAHNKGGRFMAVWLRR